jgi:hypothetical protein
MELHIFFQAAVCSIDINNNFGVQNIKTYLQLTRNGGGEVGKVK